MDERTKRELFIAGAVTGAALAGAFFIARKIKKLKEEAANHFTAADALCSLDDEDAQEEVWVNLNKTPLAEETDHSPDPSGDEAPHSLTKEEEKGEEQAGE